MKVNDIREMKTEALQAELKRLRRHLFDLRSQAVTEKLAHPSSLTNTRKDIARVMTVINERGHQVAVG